MAKLPHAFYRSTDVIGVARQLLGCILCTWMEDTLTTGRIVETEAYAGTTDRASHAFGGRRTPRTEPMYARGGCAYVYLCYGMHALFNVVTHEAGVPHAVLVRAVEPLVGVDAMLRRRRLKTPSLRLTSGPGALTQALGITRSQNCADLRGPEVWIEKCPHPLAENEIGCGTRVGVAYAGEDGLKPWRFAHRGNPWVSRARGVGRDRPQ
jgi:DNA-3-methyladenine glycosylase